MPAFLTSDTVINNQYRFLVGSRWTISISGELPNSPIIVTAQQGNATASTAQVGTTDSMGNWSNSGVYGQGDVGLWKERWTVGSKDAGDLNITVEPTSVTAQSQQVMGQNTQIGLQSQGSPMAPSQTGNVTNGTMAPSLPAGFSPILNTTIMGIPLWLLGVGAVVGFFMLKGEH